MMQYDFGSYPIPVLILSSVVLQSCSQLFIIDNNFSMKKFLQLPIACLLFFFPSISISAQPLQPFENCPGVSVAITRPGFNATPGPYQIYLIDSNGVIQPSGNPINLQINGFGLNTTDGFLYGIHESSNVATPFLTRVDKNGNFENVGELLAPPVDQFKTGIINTAAGTMDDKDNYYLIALVIDLQNILTPPELFVGKIENVSSLAKGDNPLSIKYTKINTGSCTDELFAALANPLEGALQDIAFNPSNGNIYTFIPAPGLTPTPGKIAWFKPDDNPTFTCIDPAQPNIPTNDLSGLFFGTDSALFILTIDGKYYKGDVNTGIIHFVTQSSLPLLNGNLRGDMASCVGKKPLVAFDNCPGVSVAITRPGINSTMSPYQIFLIDEAGNLQPSGNPINLQINAFGLNNKDGFLYGMHESSNVTDPFFTRVDKNGNFVDIGKLTAPPGSATKAGIINTAAATMDGKDNYYFTAVLTDTPITTTTHLPQLFVGRIENVSKLKEGDKILVEYREIKIGSCADEIMTVLSNPSNGLLQDLAYNPDNGDIYTIIHTQANLPAPAKIAHFSPRVRFPVLNCIDPAQPNIPIIDLSGMFSNKNGRLFILTIDGKYYRGNVHNGVITLITQTALPLLGNNLRGDMASCVGRDEHHEGKDGEDDDDDDHDKDHKDQSIHIAPNPVQENQMTVSINSEENIRVQMQIMGATGNPVQTRTIVLSQGSNQFQVDVSHLAQGIYSLLLIYPSGDKSAKKFIRL